MKKSILILLMLMAYNFNYGQIAVIRGVNGFVNVRKEPKTDSEIIYKLKDSEVFIYQQAEIDTKNEYITIFISKNKYQLQSGDDNTIIGYIRQDNLIPITDLSDYNPYDVTFKYQLKKFSLEDKVTEFDGESLIQINGRKFYGTNGSIPKIEVTKIEAFVNKKPIEIPNILYEDIFECNNQFKINNNNNDYIIHQWNGNGPGEYLIVWVLGNEKLKQRLILKL